jgi:hypothetical protein
MRRKRLGIVAGVAGLAVVATVAVAGPVLARGAPQGWAGLTSVTAAHIHLGATGVAGPVVVPFFNTALGDTISSVGGCVHDVDPGLIKNIHDSPSEYYVNVHDTDFPKGAIRDQLHKAGKHDDTDDD